MQITVPLTLTLIVPDQEAAARYIDPVTQLVTTDFLADLFDDGIPDSMIYGSDFVESLCGKTHDQIRQELTNRIP